jgi:hypothetical protein
MKVWILKFHFKSFANKLRCLKVVVYFSKISKKKEEKFDD